jgi:hypothetical protein
MEQNLIKSEIGSRIFTIRGMQVMLDKDLAELYGVNTMRLNEVDIANCDIQINKKSVMKFTNRCNFLFQSELLLLFIMIKQ